MTFYARLGLVRVILVYKSGLGFCKSAKTKKLAIYINKLIINVPYFCKFLTFVLYDLQTSALHKNGVEFCQEFKGHGPRHVTRVFHVSDTCFSFRYSTVCHIFANF